MEQLGRLSNPKHKTKTIYPKKIIDNHFPKKMSYIFSKKKFVMLQDRCLPSLKFFIPSYALRMTIINGKTKQKFLYLGWLLVKRRIKKLS